MTRMPAPFLSGTQPQDVAASSNMSNMFTDLERLEMLLPGTVHLVSQHPLAYALAYAERYRGDVVHLEHEWDFLVAALTYAWQQEQYENVVYLAAALAYPAGRRGNLAEAEQVLQIGVEASHRVSDTRHLASFLNRLGNLVVARGRYAEGQQIWSTGFQLAHATGSLPLLWEPFLSFVHVTDILGSYPAARQFVEMFQETRRAEDSASFVVALFARGFFSLERDAAYEDLSTCLRLLSSATSGLPSSPPHQLFSMVIQAELARIQEQYARAQAYTETALALAQLFGDHYTCATLLIDQGLFAYRYGRFDDLQQAFQRLRELVYRVETPHFIERSLFFERRLQENEGVSPLPQHVPLALETPASSHQLLSRREREVLLLVAEGLSNQDIARQLVITPGTVKKHLEHIYTRLDTHSRTSTLARARTLKIIA